MSDARTEYEKIKNCIAFNVSTDAFRQAEYIHSNNRITVYLFTDGSRLFVIKSLSGPFENGNMFDFQVVD